MIKDFVMRGATLRREKFLIHTLILCILFFTEDSVSGAAVSGVNGLWVDAFHPGISTEKDVAKCVEDARGANCNTLIVEVRRRGDVCFDSNIEKKAPGVDSKFDSLADLLSKAHDSNKDSPIEVHAWMTMYPIWRGAEGQPPTNHLFVTHPEWLDRNSLGDLYNGHDYFLDPGHPEVQRYLFNLAMEVVSKYDIDGLSLDYIHYPGKNWGYNAASVQRFNQRFNRTGTPSPNDAEWMQFRRDQITSLLRKIYLNVMDLKPQVKVSVASIVWAPVPTNQREWMEKSAAYTTVFQDWRGWMEEGIMDINLPMMYLPYADNNYRDAYFKWAEFAGNQRYNRWVVVSPALYMNSVSDAMAEIRAVSKPAKLGKNIDGVCLYSYASYSKDKLSREDFIKALTKGDGPFSKPVPVPEMPWKTHPTTGHLKGFVYSENGPAVFDGAVLTIKGPKEKRTVSDATGFYGAVDLPPGQYTLTGSAYGYKPTTIDVKVTVGKVTTTDLHLQKSERVK